MQLQSKSTVFFPQFVPQNMNGKLTYSVRQKTDHQQKNGKHALYIRVYLNGAQKKLPLNIAVTLKQFDLKKQRVKKSHPNAKDYNLIIEKKMAEINKIEINYRLSGQQLTIQKLTDDLTNPSIHLNFNAFACWVLDKQKAVLKNSTYRQQKGCLSKIKKFKDPITFAEITPDFLQSFVGYLKNNLKNKENTVQSTLKNFKKYLHEANKRGIKTQLSYTDISVKPVETEKVFLLPEELKKLYDYHNSPFINKEHKLILKRFLFSCFTGIRISDSEQLTEDNFIGEHLAFTMVKTNKFIRIKLNKTAQSLIEFPSVFNDSFSREHINRELKVIAKTLGIKKRLHFHASRHTFATNFLLSGGGLRSLQKKLGHSKIEQTLIYSHTVESIEDKQIDLLDNIVKN